MVEDIDAVLVTDLVNDKLVLRVVWCVEFVVEAIANKEVDEDEVVIEYVDEEVDAALVTTLVDVELVPRVVWYDVVGAAVCEANYIKLSN